MCIGGSRAFQFVEFLEGKQAVVRASASATKNQNAGAIGSYEGLHFRGKTNWHSGGWSVQAAMTLQERTQSSLNYEWVLRRWFLEGLKTVYRMFFLKLNFHHISNKKS